VNTYEEAILAGGMVMTEKIGRYEVALTEKDGLLLSRAGEEAAEISLTHQEAAEVLAWLFAQRAHLFQHVTGSQPHEYSCPVCQKRIELEMTALGSWEGNCWHCGARVRMSLAGQLLGNKVSAGK
jgi:hypothetical protein